jgi:hypothetical protein
MSTPRNRNAYEEISSAIQALYMEPEAIPGTEDEIFLGDKDVWAKHAIEHLHAAMALLEQHK